MSVWRGCWGGRRFPHARLQEGGSWGTYGFTHGSEPEASDARCPLGEKRGRALELSEGSMRVQGGPYRPGRLEEKRPDNNTPGGRAIRGRGSSEPTDRSVGRIGDRSHDTCKPPCRSKLAALEVDRHRTRPAGKMRARFRLVDHVTSRADDAWLRVRNRQRLTLPENSALLVDDLGRRHQRPWLEARHERTGQAEARERSLGNGLRGGKTDLCSSSACPAGSPRLDVERAGECQRSVHARLRTVSLTLAVVARVAEGSKPQWIAQCSQRGSCPGP